MALTPERGENFTNLEIEERAYAVVIRVKDGCWPEGADSNYETYQQLKEFISKCMEQGNLSLIIDLGNLGYMSERCIGMITGIYKIIMMNHGDMKLAAPSQGVVKMMKLTRLDCIFRIYNTVAEALFESGLRTYYDNLKVRRDASIDEINSAHSALLSQYKGVFKDDAEAAQIIDMANEAFDVLSDIDKRREHDAWIARMVSNQIVNQADVVYPTSGESGVKRPMSKEDQVMLQRYSKPLLIALGIVVVALSLAWGERYKPLGSAGQFVYLHDRFTGDLVTVVGPYKFAVTSKKPNE